ncbi:iron ABC transporter substrate-binding protein [Salinibacter altiplanensis]|uniref:iron ABC transporter substrate-binding protein n=1 Tax=Salinibacter altiplanensis TaxID=1803181 RepID=UPI000C9FF40F|nr:iron ABC transporter substrate-binding protein [Salinibacter altiplanensis]
MKRLLSLSLVVVLVLSLVGCGGEQQDELVIYSGRSKALVDSLVQQYRQQTDVPVRVRYGTDSQLLAALQEEGDQSPADVFWANTTGALGNAVNNGLLTELPDTLADRATRFTPSNQRWTPVTTRFRVLAYNSDTVSPEDLPDSVLDLPEHDEFEGRIGWTPAYSSFQDFTTALRVTEGEETARTWLTNMQELDPNSYTSNTPMVQALEAGEIDVALTNHYYVLRLKHGGAEGEYEEEEHEEEEHEEEEEAAARASAPVETYHFAERDLGNLALVTGAGALQTSNQPDAANRFLRYLLSEKAQSFAADRVNEYPVVAGTPVPGYMTPAEEALQLSPEFELQRLQEMDPTLELLRDVGAL